MQTPSTFILRRELLQHLHFAWTAAIAHSCRLVLCPHKAWSTMYIYMCWMEMLAFGVSILLVAGSMASLVRIFNMCAFTFSMCCCSSVLLDIILDLWSIVSRVALFINIVAALIRKPTRSNAMKEINGRCMRKTSSLKDFPQLNCFFLKKIFD